MIPVVAFIRWRRPGSRSHTIWLPLFLLWLILLPVLLLLLPFVILILALAGARPFGTLAALFDLLGALKGMQIDIDGPSGVLVIQVY